MLATIAKAPARRALVAEDDAQMRALVADALRMEGFEVEEAEDGAHMIARAASAAGFDLLVSDVRMPLVDGLSAIERLRAQRVGTPVILMTAFGDDATRARARTLGVELFDKPFKLSELRAAARRFFENTAQKGSP